MIRPYNKNDREQLLDIFYLNTPKYFDKKEIKDFKKYLEQKNDTYLTIEDNKQIVGGVGYYVNIDDMSGRITWIFIDPKYVGQGLGKNAVAYCLKIMSEDERIEKFTVTTSQLAYKFFEKFGYKTKRIVENHWGKGLDLYEMEMLK